MFRRCPQIVVAVVMLATVVVVNAADKPAAPPDQNSTRVYDIRDLLVQIPDYPYQGELGVPVERPMLVVNGESMGMPSTAPKKSTPPTREQLAEEIVDLIREAVAPDSWRENGGSLGAIRVVSGQLIITQSETNQRLIQSILSQLRETTGRMVRVQARWLLLSPNEAKGLLAPATNDPGVQLVEPAALERLAESSMGYRGEVTCFNAQVVSLASGRSHSAITGQEPVVAQNAVAMRPTVRQVQSGVMLEVLPTLQVGQKAAVVDIKSRLAEWNEPNRIEVALSTSTTQPGDRAVAGQASQAGIDRLNMVTQDLRTAIRMPLGKPVLVGGLTLDPTASSPSGPQLYLVLQIDATPEDAVSAK